MRNEWVAASQLLSHDEANLLKRALLEWGGPAWCSDQLAIGMGFSGKQDMLTQCHRLRNDIASDSPLSPADWARMILAAEIVFVSDLAGSGVEWSTTTGFDDGSTMEMLRSIQRKAAKTVSPFYGKTPHE